MFGGNKSKSQKTIMNANEKKRGARNHGVTTGYGGHFRAVQGFKYLGDK